jgi:diguanylate cyclase (GGDEF)-like protein/PAS domain S-box-containing protein
VDQVPTGARPTANLRGLINSNEFLEFTRMGFALQDIDEVILDCNETAVELFGTTRAEVIGHKFSDLNWTIVNDDGSAVTENERQGIIAVRERRGTPATVIGIDYPSRLRRWLLVTTQPTIVDGQVTGVINSFIDVTERVQREHVLQLVNVVNRLAMRSSDENELFQQLCDAIVGRGNYSLAWIGVETDTEEKRVAIVSATGATDYLYENIVTTDPDLDSGHGPTGTAIRTMATQVANDLEHQPKFDRWRARAAKFDLGAAISVPFKVNGRTAALSIYHRRSNAFNDVVIDGFEEIAREIEDGVAYQRSVAEIERAMNETSSALQALRETEKAHVDSEQRFRLAFENNMAPMVFSDQFDQVIAVNDSFCEMVGFTREELVGHDSKQFTFPEDIGITEDSHVRLGSHQVEQVRYTKRYQRKDGRILFSEVSRSVARDGAGDILYFLSSERDVTDERELAVQLSHQALHDPLTGLANRALFDDRLAQAFSRIEREGGLVAVLLLDLDDFKGVNDTHGHLIGDQLLVGIARRFELVTRAADTLSRFGGDEFLYLAEGLTSPGEAVEVAQRLLLVLAEPFIFDGLQIEQHASIGVVVSDPSDASGTELIQKADVALYEAKNQSRGSFALFTASMHQRAVTRFTLVQEMRKSLQNGEITMHYQPIVELDTTEVVGFEALMRWQHPIRGSIPPAVFIPLAEQSDVIIEVGAFALREAMSAASSWGPTRGRETAPYVTVNLAAPQFHHPELVSMIEGELERTGLDTHRLVLEITESTALTDITETLRAIQQLKRLGIGVALDDFGTGYSSLSYLRLMNPVMIKIDMYFVHSLADSPDDDPLIDSIITLGNKMRVTMLAEGIETEHQFEQLRALGCELGQGFLFSPAVPADEVAPMIARGASGWQWSR